MMTAPNGSHGATTVHFPVLRPWCHRTLISKSCPTLLYPLESFATTTPVARQQSQVWLRPLWSEPFRDVLCRRRHSHTSLWRLSRNAPLYFELPCPRNPGEGSVLTNFNPWGVSLLFYRIAALDLART